MLSNRAPAQVAQLVEQGTENPFPYQPYATEIVARFRSHVDRSGGPLACHPWRLAPDRDGYGRFSIGPDYVLAHRFALQLKLGRDLGADEVARHMNSCTTRLCCNGEHLLAGTQADNIRDRDEAGRTARGESNGNHRLTAQQVVDARRKVSSGAASCSAIARDLGVAYPTIKRAVSGVTWRHLSPAA